MTQNSLSEQSYRWHMGVLLGTHSVVHMGSNPCVIRCYHGDLKLTHTTRSESEESIECT